MLQYPFENEKIPVIGDPKKVAEGIYWLRMPLPFALNHINLWLLKDTDGWTLVDTGLNYPKSRETWETVFKTFLNGERIQRIIVTHMHPDHVGLAGWISEHMKAPLYMTSQEYEGCKNMREEAYGEAPLSALNFYQAAGYNTDQLTDYKNRFGSFGRAISPIPSTYTRLQEGDKIAIDQVSWQIIIGSGHSPEHACLYSAERDIMISGDQVLPRITSNVSLWPTSPHATPFRNWIDSCKKIGKQIPDSTLVLPAHQEPFYGLHERLSELIISQEKTLDLLLPHLTTPRSVLDCLPIMFQREIDTEVLQFATGEALACLTHLLTEKQITRELDKNGVWQYLRS